MTMMDNIKKNFKKRFWLFIIVVLVLLAYGNSGQKEAPARQTFETCHTYNSINWLGYLTPATSFNQNWQWVDGTTYSKQLDSNDIIECKSSGCYVGTISEDYAFDKRLCLPYIPNGWLAEKGQGSDACESSVSTSFDDTHVLCRALNEGETPTTCNSAEQGIANIVQSMGLSGDNCKSAYIIAIFGGAFLLLIVFAAL